MEQLAPLAHKQAENAVAFEIMERPTPQVYKHTESGVHLQNHGTSKHTNTRTHHVALILEKIRKMDQEYDSPPAQPRESHNRL